MQRSARPVRLGLLSAAFVVAATIASGEEIVRVKYTQHAVRKLLDEGYRSSATFQSLVQAIERSNAIVLVRQGYCKRGLVRACVTSVTGSRGARHLRIVVDPRTTTRRLIAAVGHELHHALEVIRSNVSNRDGAVNLYRRIGIPGYRGVGNDSFETEAALAVERQILEELDR